MSSAETSVPESVRSRLSGRNHLFFYLRKYKWHYVWGFVMLVVATVAQQGAPLILGMAIDAIDDGDSKETLIWFGVAILLLAGLESVLRYYSRNVVSGSARYVEYGLRHDMAEQLLHIDQKYYVSQQTGDLMARATNDLEWVRNFSGPILVDGARTALVVLVGMIFLLTIDVRLALIAIGYVPVVAALLIFGESTVERRYRRVQEQFSMLTNKAQENITGIRAIKAHAQEDSEIATFRVENEEMRKRAISLAYYTSLLYLGMVFLIGAATAVVLWFGGHDVADGKISIGEFVQFNAVLGLMAVQLASLGWVVTGTQQGIVAMRRINEVLNAQASIFDPEEPVPVLKERGLRGEITFQGVHAAYNDREVLHGIDLEIPAGQTVALVGTTGAGKTTLVNLIIRQQDPSAGAVLIDGVDIRRYNLAELRDAIGFVPQESFLFSDSVRENIEYGKTDPTDEQMDRAVDTSQLVNDLAQLSNGLDSVIGERGVTLSGGQKQRAALARALLKDPPILVLDDSLSHVDTHTEEEILRRLREFMSDRTTIVIAHRTSTLKSADLIVAIEHGTIAETGTHEELIALGGVYSRIYREQLLSEVRSMEIDAEAIEIEVDDAGDSEEEAGT